MTTNRIQLVREEMTHSNLDFLLVTDPSNRQWISGFTGSSGIILISKQAAYIATDSRYWIQAEQQCPGFELVKVAGASTSIATELVEKISDGSHFGYEHENLTMKQYQDWTNIISSMTWEDVPNFIPASSIIDKLRMSKDNHELTLLMKAVEIADAGMKHAFQIIKPGMTEKKLAWEIQKYVIENGADSLSFNTIVAGGEWGALPHARPRNVALKKGTGVVIDMGVKVDGYCSDLTRTFFLGAPTAKFKEVYDVVLTAQMMAIERIEAGMTGLEAHEIAASVITEMGYGDYFGHGLGHGVGIDVHENPRLSPASDTILENGHVFTIEPGVYLPNWGGVRIEDQCLMESGKVRSLTKSPKLDLEIGVIDD